MHIDKVQTHSLLTQTLGEGFPMINESNRDTKINNVVNGFQLNLSALEALDSDKSRSVYMNGFEIKVNPNNRLIDQSELLDGLEKAFPNKTDFNSSDIIAIGNYLGFTPAQTSQSFTTLFGEGANLETAVVAKNDLAQYILNTFGDGYAISLGGGTIGQYSNMELSDNIIYITDSVQRILSDN